MRFAPTCKIVTSTGFLCGNGLPCPYHGGSAHVSGPATLVLRSENAKIGFAAATYASIAATCPASCRLRAAGCYAQYGRVTMTERRLRGDVTPLRAAMHEAALLDAASGIYGVPLRLHVSGDTRTPAAARVLGAAIVRWRKRHGGPVWTYTHAWRDVPREAWGRAVSVLGSAEGTMHGRSILAAGYAPAVVVEALPADGRAFVRDGVTWIPCPQQTRGRTCTECRLCWSADALAARQTGIAFAAHGTGRKRALQVLNGPA